MKFCPVLQGSQHCYKVFINYILRLHVKSFIPARLDPSFVLPGSRFSGTKFSHEIASARLSRMKKLINISIWRNPLKYISIDRSCFYCIFTTFMTSICKIKVNRCLYRISSFCEHFKSMRIYGFLRTNTWWKPVPSCRDEKWFPHVIVGWNLSKLDGLKFHPGKTGSCNHHLNAMLAKPTPRKVFG